MKLSTKFRTYLLKGGMLCFLCCLLLFPDTALSGAKSGLLLWFNQVLPSLLPFLIISSLLLSTGLSDSIAIRLAPVLSPVFRCSASGCYAVVIGLLAGLPVGAKTISSLILSGKITKKEGQYLLPLCNNPSPLFLLGFISVTVLNRPDLRYTVLVIVTLSSVLAAKLTRPQGQGSRLTSHVSPPYTPLSVQETTSVPSPSDTALSSSSSVTTKKSGFTFSFLLLDAAIEQAFSVLTKVGGYIVLFSVLANLLVKFPLSPVILACFGSFLEITTGSTALASAALPEPLLLCLVTGFSAFGGLSTAAQTKSVLAGTKLPFAHYLMTKCMAGLFAGLLMAGYLTLR